MPRLDVWYDLVEGLGEDAYRQHEAWELCEPGEAEALDTFVERNGVHGFRIRFKTMEGLKRAKAELQAAGFRFVPSYGGDEHL